MEFQAEWTAWTMVAVKAVGLPQVRKWSGKTKILQGQGNVREFYSGSGKIDILKKSQGKLKF